MHWILTLLLFVQIPLFSIEFCQFDFNTGFLSYQTDHIWNKKGNKIHTHSRFEYRAYQVYTDVYLTPYDCIGLSSSYVQIKEKLNGNSRGFSDSELMWTHFLYIDKWFSAAIQTTAIIPSGSRIYNLRYGEFGGQLDFLCSLTKDAFKKTFYFDALAGYRMYRSYPSDQVKAYFSAGSYLFTKFYLEGSLDLQYGIFNGKSKYNYPLFLFNSNYRLLRGDIRAAYHCFENFYLIGGVFNHLWGQNIGTGSGFFAEAWLKY